MDVSRVGFLSLLVLVGALRLFELGISARNRRRLLGRGIATVTDRGFVWMVALHAGVLMAAALEVAILNRPFLPVLGAVMLAVLLLANGLRWWAIRALAHHWNVGVMASTSLGVVSSGPYLFVRHPNYAAVFVELIVLPLVHTAWITAVVAACVHTVILRGRIAVEENSLLVDPAYGAAMGGKPRFVPRWSDVARRWAAR